MAALTPHTSASSVDTTPAAMYETPPSDALSLVRDGLQILRERRRLLLASGTFFFLLLAAYAWFTPETKVFEARTLLLIEPERPRGSDAMGVLTGSEPEQGYYDTQERILRSRTVARATLTALQQASHSDANAARPNDKPSTGEEAPAIAGGDIDAFLDALAISHTTGTRLVELKFRAADAQYAARALTAHTDSYIRQTVQFTLNASREASSWLSRQVEEQQQRVTAGESALRAYQRANGPIEERHAVESGRLAELNSAVLRARAARVSKEASYERLTKALAGHNPRDLSALVPSPVVQQLAIDLTALQRHELELSSEFGERHPQRVKVQDAIKFTESRLDQEVGRAIDAVGTELAASRVEEQKSIGALEAETAAAAVLGQSAAQAEALRREIAADRALYERLRQRAQELNLASTDELTNVRVVEPVEVPATVLRSNRLRNLLLGAAGAIWLSLLLVFGVHYIDERLRSPQAVESCLGLPSIGVLPRLDGVIVNQQIFLEAMKALRAHVLCASEAQPVRVLLIASADVSEGKTLVATNLAASLAQVGRRVLLIDGDLRRPSVHEAFKLPVQPGLSEALAGSADASGSVRPTGQPNLWVLTAGKPTSHPADLLGTATFDKIMEKLSASFDSVVIDSPPVLAATDASLVAHQQAATIFVVSADRTGRHIAKAALDRLESVGARFVGVVLNRVSPDHYGPGYYARAHRYYYSAATPPDPAKALPTRAGDDTQSTL